MSRLSRILERLLYPRNTTTFQELECELGKLGYQQKRTGKTSGSRRGYFNPDAKHIILLRKLHPGKELKKYAMNLIFEELKKQKLI